MFSEQELRAIADICTTETLFLHHVERRGIPCANQLALVAGIRAKAIELSQNAAGAKAPEEAREKP